MTTKSAGQLAQVDHRCWSFLRQMPLDLRSTPDLRAGSPLPEDVSIMNIPYQLLAPLACQSKLICMGTNYFDHREELRVAATLRSPYALLKPLTTIA